MCCEPVTRRLIGAVTSAPPDRGRTRGQHHDGVAAVSAPITTIAIDRPRETSRAARSRKYDLLAVPVLDKSGHVARHRHGGRHHRRDHRRRIPKDVQKFGGMTATDEPYMQTRHGRDAEEARRLAAGCCSSAEMLTASVMQHYEGALEKAIVLTLFIPLIMRFGRQFRGRSGDVVADPRAGAARGQGSAIGGAWRCANCRPA